MKLDLVYDLLTDPETVVEGNPIATKKLPDTDVKLSGGIAIDLEDEHIKKYDPKLYHKIKNWD